MTLLRERAGRTGPTPRIPAVTITHHGTRNLWQPCPDRIRKDANVNGTGMILGRAHSKAGHKLLTTPGNR
jgi:hypothetical protein